jgi:uncharacterized C2H2 Zn-finger protein
MHGCNNLSFHSLQKSCHSNTVMDALTEALGAAVFARCDQLECEARAAKERGELQVAADKYLQAVLSSRGFYKQCRLHCCMAYEQIITNQAAFYKTMSPDHRQKVEKMAQDEHEMTVFRAIAFNLLGMNAWAECQADQAAKYQRALIDVVEECKAKFENQVSPPGTVSQLDLTIYRFAADGVTEVPMSMGSYMDNMVARAKTLLGLGQSSFMRAQTMSNFGTDAEIVERMSAGGGKCDACGKKAESVDGRDLLQCSRCKQAYYCSKACQKHQWKAGHKEACRKPNQIERGDIMLVKGIVSKPELNRKLVKIIRSAGNGRWEVVLQGSTTRASLASKNLAHIRPAK